MDVSTSWIRGRPTRPSSGGQIFYQTTGVRAPVSAVSVLLGESESGR
jgi:hypothetical protein